MFGNTLGARRKRRRRKSTGSCRVGIVRFKTKRGKVIQFRGKTGPGCPPRKKPSTRHLAPFKRALASAARACRGKHGRQFRSCVASRM